MRRRVCDLKVEAPGKVSANRENPCVAVLQAEPRPSGSVLLPRTEDKRSLRRCEEIVILKGID
jgi:hypothetical protein